MECRRGECSGGSDHAETGLAGGGVRRLGRRRRRCAAGANAEKGGTIRFTSPYAASFGSLDLHTTPRATDEIVGKAINRTLYNWDSAKNKLVLELATSVSASADGLVHTYKLRDDAISITPQDDRRRRHLVVHRVMDGSKGYRARAMCG